MPDPAPPLSPSELAAIRERWQAAQPKHDYAAHRTALHLIDPLASWLGEYDALVVYDDHDHCAEFFDNMGMGCSAEAYAAFFVGAFQDVPRLLVDLEAAREELKWLKKVEPHAVCARCGKVDCVDQARFSRLIDAQEDVGRLQRELEAEQADVGMLCGHLTKIYEWAAGVTIPTTLPDEVIQLAEERISRETEEAVKEATAELQAELSAARERAAAVPRLERELRAAMKKVAASSSSIVMLEESQRRGSERGVFRDRLDHIAKIAAEALLAAGAEKAPGEGTDA